MRTCCLIRFVLFFDLVGVARISKRLPRAQARGFLKSAADGSMKSYQNLVIENTVHVGPVRSISVGW